MIMKKWNNEDYIYSNLSWKWRMYTFRLSGKIITATSFVTESQRKHSWIIFIVNELDSCLLLYVLEHLKDQMVISWLNRSIPLRDQQSQNHQELSWCERHDSSPQWSRINLWERGICISNYIDKKKRNSKFFKIQDNCY